MKSKGGLLEICPDGGMDGKYHKVRASPGWRTPQPVLTGGEAAEPAAGQRGHHRQTPKKQPERTERPIALWYYEPEQWSHLDCTIQTIFASFRDYLRHALAPSHMYSIRWFLSPPANRRPLGLFQSRLNNLVDNGTIRKVVL